MSVYYEEIRAVIDPAQADVSPDGSAEQDVSVIVTLGARQAREQAAQIGGRR
jgi:hypothetical protein